MRAVVRWLTRYVALLGLLALPSTGCGNETNNNTTDATTTTSSSTATTGPVAFVAQARAMTFGTKDLPLPPMGSCCGWGRLCVMAWASRVWASAGSSSDWCGQRPAPRPPKPQALSDAVRNLCPAQASAVPA